MPTIDPIQVERKDPRGLFMLLQYSSARLVKINPLAWAFPREHRRINPKTQEQNRNHMDELLRQKDVKDAIVKGGS